MPVAALANTRIVFFRGLLNEIEDLRGWCAGSKHGSNAGFMQRWTVLERNDATTKDDDVVKAASTNFWHTCGNRWAWAPEREESPRKRASSSRTVSTICWDVRRRPV